MKTGKIIASVGFGKTDGHIRKLTIVEQLQQVVMSRTDGTIDHPAHGRIPVSLEQAQLLKDCPENYLLLFHQKLSSMGTIILKIIFVCFVSLFLIEKFIKFIEKHGY